MSDAYIECLVKGQPNVKAKALRILFILGAIASLVFMVILGWYWLMVVAIAFGIAIYYISGYTDVEYEYLYLDRELTIDKIYNQSKRKRIGVYSLEKVNVFAPVRSAHLDRFGKISEKPIDYSVGLEDPDKRYIMFYEGKQQILLSPSEDMVRMMRNVAPHKIFVD